MATIPTTEAEASTTLPEITPVPNPQETQVTTPFAHPQTAEIIRQVELYFSDENLPHDAHLLGLFKEGNGSVSLNEICGFKKMRPFKPKTAVREALRQSTLVEVSKDGKRLSRKAPLTKGLLVAPKVDRDRKKTVVPEDKPWLTKALMKPTGFEDYVAEGPIRPEEYLRDRGEYNADIAFASRIETAITHFCARRKMHQQTRKIFDKFMVFGGMACGQRQFIGGLDDRSMEEYTKKELAELTSNYGVAERVMDALHESEFGGAVTWEVDFAAVARGFLSSQFMRHFHWYDLQMVQTATNVLRNFYNYLLLHDVCPEYGVQLVAARKVCDDAEAELPMLKEVDQGLPGGFNVACSTLFGGRYSNLYAAGNDWARADDNLGWSQVNADCVFKAGIFAHGTEAQLRQVEEAAEQGSNSFKVISSEELGLEITRVEVANAEASTVYNSIALQNTFIRPMGKLHCKRWAAPHAAPSDLLPSSKPGPEEFEFLVDDDLLQYCVPGMKMECCVKELDLGVKWIDHIAAVYASFFTWLANEEIREWKEPGPPKEWMVRVMKRDDGVLVEGDGGIGEEREEGELDELD